MSTPQSGPSGQIGWVSAAEAGRLCHVAERTIRRWIEAGHLPADMSGPSVRIPVAALQAYIAAATATPPDPGQAPRPASGRVTWLRPDADVRTDTPPERPDIGAERPDGGPDTGPDVSSPLVAQLEAEVRFLRAELEARRREVQELHVLLQRAQMLALPAPRDETLPTDGMVSRPWWGRWRWWRR
jgi:excisionase family DNA binding protein